MVEIGTKRLKCFENGIFWEVSFYHHNYIFKDIFTLSFMMGICWSFLKQLHFWNLLFRFPLPPLIGLILSTGTYTSNLNWFWLYTFCQLIDLSIICPGGLSHFRSIMSFLWLKMYNLCLNYEKDNIFIIFYS